MPNYINPYLFSLLVQFSLLPTSKDVYIHIKQISCPFLRLNASGRFPMKEFLKGKVYAKKSITLEDLRTAIVFLNEELIVISSIGQNGNNLEHRC